MINASPQTIEAVGVAMGRARLFDNRIGDNDTARIAAWSEALEPYKFTAPQLLNAVTDHYRANPERMIMPADLIRLARENRKDTAEREKGHDPRAAITGPDRQLGSLPIGGGDGEPVWDAYDINGAIDRDCPTCDQPAGCACVNPVNDSARKIPCLSRLKAAA